MKRSIMLSGLIMSFFSAKAQLKDFNAYPIYDGKDLGLSYSSKRYSFRIWSPPADNAQLLIFKDGLAANATQIVQMKKSAGGTWTAVLPGDHKGKFYAFR